MMKTLPAKLPACLLAAALTLPGALACSSPDEGGSDGTGGHSTSTGGAAGDAAGDAFEQPDVGKSICDDELPPVPQDDVSGKWAYVEVQTQVVVAPGFSDPFRNLVVTTELWDLTQDGTAVAAHVDVCNRYVRGGVIDTSLSEALVASIPDFDATATYRADGTFTVDRIYQLMGTTLADPSDKASLPTEPDDPRVFDQEADGNPGMTVRIQGLSLDGRVYNTQWSSTAPTGATVSPDRIEGLLDFDARETVLGSDPAIIATLAPASTPHPEACWSTFQMERLSADATCSTVNDSLLTLFPDLASIDP
jgi:hypothetical protein